jgi:hypothetical protein
MKGMSKDFMRQEIGARTKEAGFGLNRRREKGRRTSCAAQLASNRSVFHTVTHASAPLSRKERS